MRCFFNLRCGPHVIADENGVGVADFDHARFEVAKVIREFVARGGDDPDRWKGWTIEMVDAHGTTQFTLALDSFAQ